MKRTYYGIAAIVVIAIIVGGAFFVYNRAFAPTASELPTQTITEPSQIETRLTNLSVPWDIVWLPDETILVTERPGTLLQVAPDGSERRLNVPRVSSLGEGGLLGLALHPDFTENQWLYLYRTYETDTIQNEVVRYRYNQTEHRLEDATTIIDRLPGARYHDGGRIAFGPDGYLYVTVGDGGEPELAQDRTTLHGTILRLTDTGDIPVDNPWDSPVYSYGHRNAQGLAWDASGQLWSTEHGRSGMQSGMDELNRIEAGANYGWPVIEGDETNEEMVEPVAHSGPDETWAPASLTRVDDYLFFGGLRGERLYRAELDNDGMVALTTFFGEERNRLRTVTTGPDGALYLLTSNTDGRGQAKADDDRLIRVPTELVTQ